MKVLWGYIKYIQDKRAQSIFRSHDIKWFGKEGSDVIIPLEGIPFKEILERLPSGWIPDIVIFTNPEYYHIPSGIEESPFPTAALISDWNLSFDALKKAAGCFDYLFTDQKGVAVFKRHGYDNVDYFPMFSFDPEVHRSLPDVEKVYDICFIGNLNHSVQRERANWLKRIARLSSRYKVIIAGGIYGEDYTRLLNQSKIVFNRSIRGEMNMRAYEAPACRTLLFFEEENLEVRNFYKDRVHCVLYNEENLEELLDYYLQNETEREEIAKRGYERVQKLTHEKKTERLLNWIEKNMDKLKKNKRKILEYSLSERHRIRAVHAFWSVSTTPKSLEVAGEDLAQGLRICPEDPELWNNMGVVLAIQGFTEKDSNTQHVKLTEALNCFQKAIEKNPIYALVHFNRGYCHYAMGQWEGAEASVLKAISNTEENPDDISSLSGLYLPALYNTFKVENERNTFRYADPHEFHTEKTRLFLWRFYDLLGNIYSKKGDMAMARQVYTRAIEKRPDMGETHYKLGQTLERMGEFEEALHQYEDTNNYNPFIFDCWKSEVNLLSLMGRWREAGEKSLEYRTIFQAMPNRNDLQQFFASMTLQSLSRHVKELMVRRRYVEAITYLKELIKIDRDSPKTYTLLGECFFTLRRYKEAESYLLQALDLNPRSEDVLISLGVVYHMQGKRNEAFSYFKKAEEINPVNPDLLANYALIKAIHCTLR